MTATDAIKDNVYALAGEAVNFLHEVLMLVVIRSGKEAPAASTLTRTSPTSARGTRLQRP
jgi:hypothetical protein